MEDLHQIHIDDIHEYDYSVKTNEDTSRVHSLYYSSKSTWSKHVIGELAASIIDDGNGYTISKEISIKKGRIEYSDAEKLHILLRLADDSMKYQMSQPVKLLSF